MEYIGGKILGKGSYGCIFRPALSCKETKTKKKTLNTISKIYFHRDGIKEAEIEFNINSQIKKIKNHSKWASIFTTKCKPKNYEELLKEDDEIAKCKMLEHSENLIMLQGNYGGVDIDNYITDQLITSYQHDLLRSNMEPFIAKYNTFLLKFKNVLKGLCDMNKHNICHMDIKYENLVINNNVIKLIDFGLSNNSKSDFHTINKRAYSELRNINRYYHPYPPEFIYSCTYSDYYSIMNTELELISGGTFRDNFYTLKELHEKMITDVKNMDKYIINLIKRNLDNPLSDVEKKKLYDKIDIYSLGYIFIYIFNIMNEYENIVNNVFIDIINDPIINPFIELCGKMLQLNYYDRISAEDAYKEYCIIYDFFTKKKKKKNMQKQKHKRKKSRRK